ncbi:hypothetical protein N7495_001420, partial [Penicillium taxi]|uniref:uncharacterized protein n=1 Tax=Penicillium taxi TaxID=168475 RepID=UPI002544FDE9
KSGLIGHTFNKALKKMIPVFIATTLPTRYPDVILVRPVDVIAEQVKVRALAMVKDRVENGKVFNDNDLMRMERVVITISSSHMPHASPSDPNIHYSVQGEDEKGVKVKSGHISIDPTKQTVSLHHLT